MSNVSANIPAWQANALNQLSQQGSLSGVNPAALAAIDVAESGGKGGGINSSGYGGYFGLGANRGYGSSGQSVTTSQLQGTTTAAFVAQAEAAAAAFRSYLDQANGNALRAETIYQNGPNTTGIYGEGVSVFQSLGLGPNSGLSSGTVSGTGSSANPSTGSSSSSSTTLTATQAGQPGSVTVLSTPLGNVNVPSAVITRGLILLVGVFLVYSGIKELFGSSASPSQIVVKGASSAKNDTKKLGDKSIDAAAAG